MINKDTPNMIAEYTRLEELQGTYSDMYKDTHGFRPRHVSPEVWNSEAALEAELQLLAVELDRVIEDEKAAQDEAVVALEAKLTEIINMGAKNRETAIRWLADSMDVECDMEYLCYKLNVPYGYFKKVA